MNTSACSFCLLLAASAAPTRASAPSQPAKPQPAPEIVITFRPTAEVRGAAIRLADVAVVESDDTAAVTALETVEVGAAPLFGHSRSVSAAYAKIKVRQAVPDTSRVLFGGPELCTVSRPEQVLPGAAIEKAACDAVEAGNPGAGA